MNPTIDVLEKYGLITSERVKDHIYSLNSLNWNDLLEELNESLRVQGEVPINQESDLTPFNFVASSSIRGETGCSAETCRLSKTNMLGRYAGLFCDHVVLPVHLHRIESEPTDFDKRRFSTSLISLLELRPLIDVNIVKPVLGLNYCPRCNPNKLAADEIIVRVADKLLALNYQRFSVSKVRFRSKEDRLALEGPEEFIEHGAIYRRGPFPFPIKGLRYGRLPDSLARKTHYVEGVFHRIIKETVLQQIYGARFNAKYLTDLPGETTVLSVLKENDQLAAQTSTLCAQLAHRIPLLGEIPLETIVRIRKEDHDVFLSYRAAIQKIIKDHLAAGKGVGEVEARDLFSDILEPEIARLNLKAKSERGSLLKKSGAKFAATFAAVALGVHTGIVPTQMAAIVGAIGGFSALGNIAEALASLKSSSVRNDNLFFLLRLKQESGI